MGRSDAVQVILEVVAECRRIEPRMVVSYEPGWETRGNGTRANYDFGNVHHTAIPSSLSRPFPGQNLLRDGRVGLSGPLCNFAGPACTVEAPRLHVVAAQPANHAGASRASGPVPALSLYNPRSLGLEIDYAGTVPMLPGQLYAAKIWSKAVAKAVGEGNIEVIRAHAETSITGKWDPGYAPGRTIDMAAFRRDAHQITRTDNQPAVNQILGDEDMRVLRDNVGTIYLDTGYTMEATGNAELASLWQRKYGSALALTQGEVGVLARDNKARLDSLTKLFGSSGTGGTGGTGSAPDVETLATALAQPSVAAAIGLAVAKAQDTFARDNNPATGPAT